MKRDYFDEIKQISNRYNIKFFKKLKFNSKIDKDKMVAILPIKTNDNNFKDPFKGEEYLGLYYYVDKTNNILYIQESSSKYISFEEWLNGKKL